MNKILLAFALAAVGFFLATLHFSQIHATLIALIVFLVVLWTNEGLPLGVVSLLPIILFPTFDIMSTNDTATNYSKSIIFLFLGGFMIAIATQKIDLHKFISNKLLSVFPNTARGILFSLALTSAILSSLISNTTTALLLVPIAMFLTNNNQLKLRLVLAIAYGASIGGIVTPIGTPPNLILLGFFEDNAIESISFIKWMAMTLPLAVFMLIIIPYVLSIGIKNIKLENKVETLSMTKDQKKLLYILGSLIVLLLLNSKIEPFYSGLGLNEKGILLSYGLLMFLPKFGFLNWEDTKKVPYEIIFLFGAGFSIAAAFSKTGLANEIASNLLQLSLFPPLLLILIVAAMITFTTEVTSNTALISIALPIIYSLGQSSNIDTNLLIFVATICASYAFMLPIATPPNAIAMSSGVLKVKDMAKYGFIFNIVGICAITFIAMTYWKYYL